MAKRCQHRRAFLIEQTVIDLYHEFQDGEFVGTLTSKSAYPTGKFFVRCTDCKRRWIACTPSRLPKWAKKLWEHLGK